MSEENAVPAEAEEQALAAQEGQPASDGDLGHISQPKGCNPFQLIYESEDGSESVEAAQVGNGLLVCRAGYGMAFIPDARVVGEGEAKAISV